MSLRRSTFQWHSWFYWCDYLKRLRSGCGNGPTYYCVILRLILFTCFLFFIQYSGTHLNKHIPKRTSRHQSNGIKLDIKTNLHETSFHFSTHPIQLLCYTLKTEDLSVPRNGPGTISTKNWVWWRTLTTTDDIGTGKAFGRRSHTIQYWDYSKKSRRTPWSSRGLLASYYNVEIWYILRPTPTTPFTYLLKASPYLWHVVISRYFVLLLKRCLSIAMFKLSKCIKMRGK